MNFKIVFITGGARSGKSSFALNEASKIRGRKAYIATAEALDNEMKERIREHKIKRDEEWVTYEEPNEISGIMAEVFGKYSVVVLDCLTLWLSNILMRYQDTACVEPARIEHRTQDVSKTIQKFINHLQKLKNTSSTTHHESRFYIVSNEIGMGIVPENKLARDFRDLAGFLNQKIAEIADEVYTVISGIAVKIKHENENLQN
jgi:adenosylcobinamide kinase/adenosylcobinamide-phosphate guanylyltransferase